MKLYYVEGSIQTMFLSDQPDHSAGLQAVKLEGRKFLQKESENGSFKDVRIKEIRTYEEVPEAWKNSGFGLWGVGNDDDEVTVEAFFKNRLKFDSEYKTYLKLKKKFENL
jgi:hypothetical protein